MMAEGTYATLLLATPDLDGTFAQLEAGEAEIIKSRPSSRTAFATAPSVTPQAA